MASAGCTRRLLRHRRHSPGGSVRLPVIRRRPRPSPGARVSRRSPPGARWGGGSPDGAREGAAADGTGSGIDADIDAERPGQAGQLQHPQHSCLRGGQQDPAPRPPGPLRRHCQSAQRIASSELHSPKVHDHAPPGPDAVLDSAAAAGALAASRSRLVPPPQSRGRRVNSAHTHHGAAFLPQQPGGDSTQQLTISLHADHTPLRLHPWARAAGICLRCLPAGRPVRVMAWDARNRPPGDDPRSHEAVFGLIVSSVSRGPGQIKTF